MSPAGLSAEQYSKLSEQKTQYVDAKEKLDGQLLKLKEQRETLKEGGAKHEDAIMKENARLQVRKKYFPFIFSLPLKMISSRSTASLNFDDRDDWRCFRFA